MTEKISDELNYSPVISNHSTPVFRTVQPQNSATVTLSAAATSGPVEFVIPPSVFNFSKSRLNFDLNVTATAASYSNINANLLTTISRVVCYDSATNAQLLDISSFEKYASMISSAGTSLTDFLTKSFASGNPATTIANAQPVEDIGKLVTTAANYVIDGTAVAGTTSVDLVAQGGQTQRRQFFTGGSNAAIAMRVSLPLSAFKFTVLASDKLLYSPSQIVLQIYFNATNNFGFITTANTDVLTGEGVLAATTVTNLSLSLCNEGNLQIVSSVIDRVMKEGLSMPIAYPSITRVTNVAATSVSTYIPLTKAYGNRILGMVSAIFFNGNFAKANARGRWDLTQYNTFLNNVAILSQSGFTTNLGRGEDYILANKDFFKSSALETIGDYRIAEWVHVDSFKGRVPLHEWDQHEIDGLDVGMATATYSQQYNFAAGVSGVYITAIIGQKQMTITNQGVMVQ